MRIPKDLKREHVLKAIEDLDNGVPSLFGPSRKFDLEYEGRRYPPKAVLGGAMSHLAAEFITFETALDVKPKSQRSKGLLIANATKPR